MLWVIILFTVIGRDTWVRAARSTFHDLQRLSPQFTQRSNGQQTGSQHPLQQNNMTCATTWAFNHFAAAGIVFFFFFVICFTLSQSHLQQSSTFKKKRRGDSFGSVLRNIKQEAQS